MAKNNCTIIGADTECRKLGRGWKLAAFDSDALSYMQSKRFFYAIVRPLIVSGVESIDDIKHVKIRKDDQDDVASKSFDEDTSVHKSSMDDRVITVQSADGKNVKPVKVPESACLIWDDGNGGKRLKNGHVTRFGSRKYAQALCSRQSIELK